MLKQRQRQQQQQQQPTSAAAHYDAPLGTAGDDTFAPTGAQQDDLFDDVVPPPESMRLRSDDDLFSDDFTPAAQPIVEPSAPQSLHEPPPRPPFEALRARGRGRGRGRGHRDSRDVDGRAQNQPQAHDIRNKAPENAPAGPRKDVARPVRGDRQATGGIRKPKLTEEELAEKMARIHIKNASLTAAHARAEADAASFAEREQQAKTLAEQRRKEERRDRQQLMGEREKNRLRKLKAMTGREWDAEKQEADFDKGARFDKPGGFAGDQQDYDDGRQYLYREPKDAQRGQSGRRGNHAGQAAVQVVPTQEEFPALSAETTASTSAASSNPKTAPAAGDESKANTKSWADQVESAL